MKYLRLQNIVLILLLTSCSAPAKPSAPAKMMPAEFKQGQKHFDRVCEICHGPEGAGQAGAPKLTQEKYSVANFSDEKISTTILMGSKSGKMPSQKRTVKKGEVKEIIKYIRYLQKREESKTP